MGFARFGVGAIFAATLVFYLFNTGELEETAQYGAVAILFVLGLIFIKMGAKNPEPVPQRRPQQKAAAPKAVAVEEEAVASNIPAPVTSEPEDGASLRDRKMAKIEAANAATAAAMAQADADDDVEEVEVTVEMEDVHVADEYVVEVSPESIEEADIDSTISHRRKVHAEVRERIEKRRRSQLADIRASTARMWEEQDAGEDLVALLQTPGHGHTVLNEPLNPEAGHVYGATFIRIDESRILKLRTPLDTGFEDVEKAEEPEVPALVTPDGKELPPLLGPDGKPLPMPLPGAPLPMPAASNALAALEDEINN